MAKPLNEGLPRHAGPTVLLGELPFVLPPMSIKVRKMEINAREALAAGSAKDEEALVTQVVLLTLQRNYPLLTAEQLEELASYDQILEAYLVMREHEARLMASLGERAATGMLVPVAQPPQTS